LFLYLAFCAVPSQGFSFNFEEYNDTGDIVDDVFFFLPLLEGSAD